MENYIENIIKVLQGKISSIKDKDIVVSFSGGIDSSMCTFLAKKQNKNVIGVYAGKRNTKDDYASQESAALLGIRLQSVYLSNSVILKLAQELKSIIDLDLVETSYLLPLYAVAKNANAKVIIMGQGSDELFLGYHLFREMSPTDAIKKSNNMYLRLQKIIKEREHKICEHFGKKLVCPFISNELFNIVSQIPINIRYSKTVSKPVLREVAKELGLPEKIAKRPKKAAQYGSGIMKVLLKDKKRHEKGESFA